MYLRAQVPRARSNPEAASFRSPFDGADVFRGVGTRGLDAFRGVGTRASRVPSKDVVRPAAALDRPGERPPRPVADARLDAFREAEVA